MGRNGTFNTTYFGFYHTVKEYSPALEDPWCELYYIVNTYWATK